MNYKYVFLILHYQSLDLTNKCIESITEKCADYDYHIVVVDNASPNNSGKALEEKYKNSPACTVLLNTENLGFAKGNNFGLKYIVENYTFDFVLMINNDIELIDKTFLKGVDDLYRYYHFSCLGPQIVLPSGKLEKYPFTPLRLNDAKKRLKRFRIYNFLCKIHLHNAVLKVTNKNGTDNNHEKCIRFGVALHGSALIFSKNYFEKFVDIYPKTFLYMEEQFLFYRLFSSGMLSVYCPSIKLFHNSEGSSRNIDVRKKLINFYTREIDSCKLLISYLENGQEV